ncbi:hypothetical protein SL003B_1376 [Polymorphum gilvum SL003B-26A1]|uniref:Uncharacterized protein n=1 Tax=Polymorphum gilvum (strain LMG 25793 / CGMCC 1.9160 / SL003B-26A1) TaxID=991905 RepID=F2J2A8_POLGS|nr:hypothetical protein SL003B_1376 [Polymorphum gilvum SL003B-26A1]
MPQRPTEKCRSRHGGRQGEPGCRVHRFVQPRTTPAAGDPLRSGLACGSARAFPSSLARSLPWRPVPPASARRSSSSPPLPRTA